MHFFIKFSVFSSLLFSLLMGVIVSVDPYDKLGFNPWKFKTKAVAQSRENKFLKLESSNKDYKVFVLGSSAAHRYPMKKIRELTGLEAFNYSAQHTNPEDYLAIVRHVLEKWRPELIFLQVDFGELNKNYETSNQLYTSPLAKYLKQQKKNDSFFDHDYLTLAALGDALRVVYVNKWGKALHDNYLEDGDYIDEKVVEGPVALAQSSYSDWELSQERLGYLAEIKQLCDQHKIRLIVFTAPLAYEHYKVATAHPGHQLFIQSVLGIFQELWNFNHESIKDYSSYRHFQDSTHARREFSSLLLERMLTGEPADLGEKLILQQVSAK
jgi:hypothetical protein